METIHSSTAAAYVAAGIGIAVIDVLAVAAHQRDELVVRPFSPTIETQFGALYAAASSTSALAVAFTKVLKSAMSEVLAS